MKTPEADCSGDGGERQNKEDERDCLRAAGADQARYAATVAARLHAAGFSVRADGAGFAVIRWGRVAALPDLKALHAFAKRAGVVDA